MEALASGLGLRCARAGEQCNSAHIAGHFPHRLLLHGGHRPAQLVRRRQAPMKRCARRLRPRPVPSCVGVSAASRTSRSSAARDRRSRTSAAVSPPAWFRAESATVLCRDICDRAAAMRFTGSVAVRVGIAAPRASVGVRAGRLGTSQGQASRNQPREGGTGKQEGVVVVIGTVRSWARCVSCLNRSSSHRVLRTDIPQDGCRTQPPGRLCADEHVAGDWHGADSAVRWRQVWRRQGIRRSMGR